MFAVLDKELDWRSSFGLRHLIGALYTPNRQDSSTGPIILSLIDLNSKKNHFYQSACFPGKHTFLFGPESVSEIILS